MSGTAYVQTGQTYTFKATPIPIFPPGVSSSLVEQGEWILPDGSTAPGTTLNYTIQPGDTSVAYHVWINGISTADAKTTYGFRAWTYVWPQWAMSTRVIDNIVPATVQFVLAPAAGSSIQSMGGQQPTYAWAIPSSFSVISNNNQAVTLQANQPGTFQVVGTVSDSNGNVTNVTSDTIVIAPSPGLVPALTLISGDRWNRAPNMVYARLNLVSVPKNDSFATATFSVDNTEVSTGKASVAYLNIPTAGTHEVEALVTSTNGAMGTTAQTIDLIMGDSPVCTLSAVGDMINVLSLLSHCTVQDGYISSYQWTSNGQPLAASGSNITFAKTDLTAGVSTVTVTAVTDKGQSGTATWNHP